MKINFKCIFIAVFLILFFMSAINIISASDSNPKIEKCTISTQDAFNERTFAKIYVGEDFANKDVQIQIFYSCNGKKLNPGNKVKVTVDNKGYIEVYSAQPLNEYPDYAKINLYNSKGSKLFDSKNVTLSGVSAEQSFNFKSNNPIKIKAALFSTPNASKNRTYAVIYVGENHSNENVQIQIFYSNDGKKLNPGNKVKVKVDKDGCIEVYSVKPLNKYPDLAEINLYDSTGSKLLDSKSAKLTTSNETQIFSAYNNTGSSTSINVQSSSSNKNSAERQQTYIGNKNTKKFHYPGCYSVSRMKNSNKVYLSSRSSAISRGYSSCAICNP